MSHAPPLAAEDPRRRSRRAWLVAVACALLLVAWLALLRQPALAPLRVASIAGAAALLATLVVMRARAGPVVLAAGALFCALRLPYAMGSGFQILPFGDSYWDVAVVREFLQEGRAVVVPPSDSVAMQLTWYSSWPMLHACAAALAAASGADVVVVAVLMTLAMGLGAFLATCALAEAFLARFGGGRVAFAGAAIFLAVMPESVFWSTSFVRQSFALPFFILLFLAILRRVEDPTDRGWRYVSYACMSAIVLSHHFTTFTFLLLAMLIAGLWMLARALRVRFLRSDARDMRALLAPATLGCSLVLLWCITVANVIFPHVRSLLTRYGRLLRAEGGVVYDPTAVILPASLQPPWYLAGVLARDALLYAGALVGFALLLFATRASRARTLYATASAAFGVLFFVFLFWTEPFRLLALAAPFAAIAWGLFLARGVRARGLRVARPVLVAGAVLLAAPLLWAHTYAPTHLSRDASQWDPATGEHWLGGPRVAHFVEDRLPPELTVAFYADDANPFALVFETERLRHLHRLAVEPEGVHEADTAVKPVVLVATRGMQSYEYYASKWGTVGSPEEGAAFAEEMRSFADAHGDKLYDAGLGAVWIL